MANGFYAPNIGSEIMDIIGIGPDVWPIWQGVDYLQPYFQRQGLELESIDDSNWSAIVGGAVTVRAIVRAGFNTMAEAQAAMRAALSSAGFDVQGHTNVPL